MTISPEYITSSPVYVLEAEGEVRGFYGLKPSWGIGTPRDHR
ncbi:hypothetical protein [Brevibacillus massiliensis]|nr:hypothetical protein [Brevibacillus massiliensis]